MRRLALLMLSSVTSALCALPVGNPMDASLYTNGVCTGGSLQDPHDPHFQWSEQLQLRAGFYGDYVFNQRMQRKRSGNVQETRIMTNAGVMSVNVCEVIDVFWTLGATNLSVSGNGSLFSSDATLVDINFDPNFSWSIGGRATVWHCGPLYTGVEVQFFRSRTKIDSVLRYANGDITYLNAHNKAAFEQWQVGIGFAYETELLIPYAAFKATTGKLQLGDTSFVFQGTNTTYTLHDLQPRYLLGYAIGCTCMLSRTAGVTVEGSFFNEKAVNVTGQLRF